MSPDASACLQVCFYDPAGTESKAVAVIKIGVKLDIPFEIFCRSDRTAGQDGFGVGTSITAFAEVRSDYLPMVSYRADFQWLPMNSDEACQASSIPYYSPKGNNQWFGPNAEWQWRDAYNFECAGMCGYLCSCSIIFLRRAYACAHACWCWCSVACGLQMLVLLTVQLIRVIKFRVITMIIPDGIYI